MVHSGDKGRLYCLVPLSKDLLFPFKIGIDADWFMPSDRKSVNNDNKAQLWHTELMDSTLPSLISEYLTTLGSMKGKERLECTNIFPDNEKYPLAFQFLGENKFQKTLKDELAKCKFVMCADGEVRMPTEVRRVPVAPGKVERPISQQIYSDLINKCFKLPIMDPDSIHKNATNYLANKLELFEFPDSSEIIVEEVRKLWDPKAPSHYRHA